MINNIKKIHYKVGNFNIYDELYSEIFVSRTISVLNKKSMSAPNYVWYELVVYIPFIEKGVKVKLDKMNLL